MLGANVISLLACANHVQFKNSNFMNFKCRQKVVNFWNLIKILRIFFTIFTQHLMQSHKIIIMSKFQLVK